MSDIDDAMEMLGSGYEPAAIIEEPRRRRVMGERPGFDEQETAAWVKLSTAFKPHIKELKGAPLAVWLYLSLSINRNGIAFPGIRTMAEDLGYSHQGIIDAIATLEGKGYLTVTRGQKRYNLYQPEFAANGRGKEPVNLVDSRENQSTLQTDESTFSDNESTFFPNESSGLDSNKNNKIKQEKQETAFSAFFHYQNNIAMLVPFSKSRLDDMIAEYTDAWVCDAIDIAVERNKRNLGYIEGILRRWKESGKTDGKARITPPERANQPAAEFDPMGSY